MSAEGAAGDASLFATLRKLPSAKGHPIEHREALFGNLDVVRNEAQATRITRERFGAFIRRQRAIDEVANLVVAGLPRETAVVVYGAAQVCLVQRMCGVLLSTC
jgi:hypothetical protein